MKKLNYIILISTIIGLSGCTSIVSERRNRQMREQIETDNLKLNVRKLTDRVNELSSAQQDIYNKIDILEFSLKKSNKDLIQIDDAVKNADIAIQKTKQEIINNLSIKIEKIIKAQNSSLPRVEEGRVHTVEAGQTLSEIASAYGINVRAIVKANKLKNADSIIVGQKLFIPE